MRKTDIYTDQILLEYKKLNSYVINHSFKRLYDNDDMLYNSQNYVPNIWECKWFCDDSVQGYNIGDVVWKNNLFVGDDYEQFFRKYDSKITEYANRDKNLVMNTIFSNGFANNYDNAEFDSEKQHVLDEYTKLINGYSLNGSNSEITYPKMFDVGCLYQNVINLDSQSQQPLKVYISLINDNKEDLSNSLAWKDLSLTSTKQFNDYIYNMMVVMLSNHIYDYHYGNLQPELNESQKYNVLSVFVSNNLSQFSIKKVFSKNKLLDHNQYVNSQGFDCVKLFVKIPQTLTIQGKEICTYKWFRLWNSGYLEHGGVVQCNPSNSSQYSDYYVKVNFDWEYQSPDQNMPRYAPVYNYEMLSSYSGNSIYGDYIVKLNYADNASEVYALSNNTNDLGIYKHYQVQLAPVKFNVQTDLLSSDVYDNVSAFISNSYWTQPSYNQNKTYATNEVHHMTNSSFCFTKNNINDLASPEDFTQLYSYYATGFTTDRSMFDDEDEYNVGDIGGDDIDFGDNVIITPTNPDESALDVGNDYTSFTLNIRSAEDKTFVIQNIVPYNNQKVVIDWGDGSIQQFNDSSALTQIAHRYEKDLTYGYRYEVKISNAVKSIQVSGRNSYASVKNSLTNINKWSSTLTSVADYSFFNCQSLSGINALANIDGSGKIKSIGKYVFSGCKNLTQDSFRNIINAIDASVVKTLPVGCFSGCTKVVSLDGISKFSKLDEYAFAGTNITIDSNVREDIELGKGVFSNCNSITSLDGMPMSEHKRRSLPEQCFYQCKNLITVDLTQLTKMTSIPKSCFQECNKLQKVFLPDSIEIIDDYAFAYCNRLEDFANISKLTGVTSIGEYAFYGACSNAKQLRLEATSTIGQYAFNNAKSMETLILPATLMSIGDYAFSRCINLKTIVSNANQPPVIQNNTFGNSNELGVEIESYPGVAVSRDKKLQANESYSSDNNWKILIDNANFRLVSNI